MQKLDWWQKKKKIKKEDKHFCSQLLILFQQRHQQSRSSYRYKETEKGELSNSLKTWAKRKVLNSLVRHAGTNFGRQRLSHHYVPIYAGRLRCKSCPRRWQREWFAKDNLSLERTRSNIRNIWDHKNSDVLCKPRETESKLQMWDFDPILPESRNWPNGELQGQAVHAKNFKNFSSSRWSWSDEFCFLWYAPRSLWRPPPPPHPPHPTQPNRTQPHSLPLSLLLPLLSPLPPNPNSPVHTLCCRTHILSAHIRTSSCVHIHAWLKVPKVCCMRMSLISISPSPFPCFTLHPCCSRTDTSTPCSRPHSSQAMPDPKARVKRTSVRAPRSLATWPRPVSTQVISPKSSTRSLLWTETRRPSTIRTTITSLTSPKSHARVLNSSVFPQCLKPLFRTFLMVCCSSECKEESFSSDSQRMPLLNEISEKTWNEELNKLFLEKFS